MVSAQAILSGDATIAVASHYLWFKKYEPTSYRTISTVILLLTSPIVYLLRPLCASTTHAIALAWSTYILALFSSIVVYRLSPWHPLARVPGPTICKVTKLWAAYIAWTGERHRYTASLHKKYGQIVRIGPNDISVTDKGLFPRILGAQGMPKGPIWPGRRIVTGRPFSKHRSLHAVRDVKLHAELRKPWNKAFGKEPMKDYEASVVKNAAILIEQLHGLSDKVQAGGEKGEVAVDVTLWASYFAFDFMGDMVFGRSYDFLRNGDPKGTWDIIQKSLIWPNIGGHIPWVAPLTHLLPSVLTASNAFLGFATSQAKRRAASEPVQRDLFYHLIKHTEVEPGTSALPIIMSDAVLAIFAGSDTTTTTLSNAIYYLVRYPEWQERVRREVDEVFDYVAASAGSNQVDLKVLADLKDLSAVINETLRLQPSVPTMLQRAPAPGSGGAWLGTLFLPEDNSVQVPPYAVHRDARYFSPRPDDFMPERWLHTPTDQGDTLIGEDFVLDRSAFIPFSMGPGNCAGRRLAMKQLRYTIALLLREFEFHQIKDGGAGGLDRWEENLLDKFLMVRGELKVLMAPRRR